MGSIPGQGTKIPHTLQQPSLRVARRESMRHNERSRVAQLRPDAAKLLNKYVFFFFLIGPLSISTARKPNLQVHCHVSDPGSEPAAPGIGSLSMKPNASSGRSMGQAFPAYERPCCGTFSGHSVLHTPRGQPCARASCHEAGLSIHDGRVCGWLQSSLLT